jgi:hypothetical protein
MFKHRDPVEVLTTLRTAQQLLAEEAEQLRRRAGSRADSGDWPSTARYRAMLDAAADLDALALDIAVGVDPV